LEALKAEKTAQKEKEILARNQAQHKEVPSGPSVPKKEDGKKKGVAVPKQPELAQLSKKAAKRAAAAAREAAAQSNAVVAGPANQPAPVKPSSPKHPRAPRQQPVIPAQASPSIPVPDGSGGIVATGTSPPTGPTIPRRGRPVVSIASRQFEAALGGTGVAVAGGSGGERKSRREREREREKGKEAVAGSPPIDKDIGKSREHGGSRRKEGKAAGRGTNSETAAVTIPTILQRTDGAPPIINILQREGPPQGSQIVALSVTDESETRSVPSGDGVPVRGTSRRWKGRGRGSSSRGS
jgi:regulator of nonsense transcripts 3